MTVYKKTHQRHCLLKISTHVIMFYIQVNYINMIRDPVDRIVSMFHFLRKTKKWESKPSPPKEWFEKDFDSCVNSGDLECQVRQEERQKIAAKKHHL